MKYFVMMLGLGMVFSSSAFANAEAECWFGSKKGTKCRADIELDFSVSTRQVVPLDFYLECNNGFTVDDDDNAVGVVKDNDGWVIAEDGENRDDVAIVEVIDLLSEITPTNERKFDAELIIASGHKAQRLEGKCEIDLNGGGAQ